MRRYHRGVLLALDTSAGASTALISHKDTDDLGQILAQWSTDAPNTHAEVLAPAVQEVLGEVGATGEQISGVVVGVGPGPFTGLRVGLALGHALAEGWGKPLHGICSLDSLALRAVDAGVEGEFLVATDARRREVYWAAYEHDEDGSRLIQGPFVGPAAELPQLPAVGAGVGLYPEQLQAVELPGEDPSRWTPHAAELGRLAQGALAGELNGVLCEPRPLYLRESDAKVPAQMKKSGT